jgi:hypothetical protein
MKIRLKKVHAGDGKHFHLELTFERPYPPPIGPDEGAMTLTKKEVVRVEQGQSAFGMSWEQWRDFPEGAHEVSFRVKNCR